MTQGSLLAVSERQELTPDRLIACLRGRGWILRGQAASELQVSVRAVRDAANGALGAILSGPQGLKCTIEATEAEIDACLAVFVSQISTMTERVVRTRAFLEARHHQHIEVIKPNGHGFDLRCECGAIKYFSVQEDSWVWKVPEGV